MNNIIKRKWNQNSMVIIEDLQGMAFQAESGGHTFQISGIDGEGNTVALSGTPAGVMLRSDGQDVTLTCSVSEGVVSATLPANAYVVPGRFGLTIFLTSDGQKTAIYAAVGTVGKTSSGTVAPPAGSDVVDLVNAIATAVATIPASYTDLMASVAPTYSSSGLYAVGSYAWYNGKLYRCTTAITSGETWTSGHWTLANIGSDLVDLKSALDDSGNAINEIIKKVKISLPYYIISNATIENNGKITASSGSTLYVFPVFYASYIETTGWDLYGLFTEKPSIGSFTYNNSRTIGGQTTISIPDGIFYIAFRRATTATSVTAEIVSSTYYDNEIDSLNSITSELIGRVSDDDSTIKELVKKVKINLPYYTIQDSSIGNDGYVVSSTGSTLYVFPVSYAETIITNGWDLYGMFEKRPAIGVRTYNNSRTIGGEKTITIPSNVHFIAFRLSTTASTVTAKIKSSDYLDDKIANVKNNTDALLAIFTIDIDGTIIQDATIGNGGVIESMEGLTVYVFPTNGLPKLNLSGCDLYAFYEDLPTIGSQSYNQSRVISTGGIIDVPSVARYISARKGTNSSSVVVKSIGEINPYETEERIENTEKWESDNELITGQLTNKVGISLKPIAIADAIIDSNSVITASTGNTVYYFYVHGSRMLEIRGGYVYAFYNNIPAVGVSAYNNTRYVISQDGVFSVPENVKFIAVGKHPQVSSLPTVLASTIGVEDVLFNASCLSMFKTMGTCGDSYTEGDIVVPGTNTAVVATDRSWGKVLERKYGIDVSVYARGGASVKSYLTHALCLPKLLSESAKELYAISLGHNDMSIIEDSGWTDEQIANYIGTVDDLSGSWEDYPDTFFGNYGKIIEQIQNHAEHAFIVLLRQSKPYASTVGGSRINDAISAIGEHYELPVFDPELDPYLSSSTWVNTMSHRHPLFPGYAGMAEAFARLFNYYTIKYADYFGSFLTWQTQ